MSGGKELAAMCDQAMQLKPNAGMADEEIAVKLFEHCASNSKFKLAGRIRAAMARRRLSGRDWGFERLEGRTLFSTFVVNVTGDPTSLPGNEISLRKAVIEANAINGVSVIKFDPGVFSAPQTIDLRAPLLFHNPLAKIAIKGPAAQLTLNQDLDFATPVVIAVDPKATLRMSRVDVTNDSFAFGTAVIENAGRLAMVNCTVTAMDNTDGIRGIYNIGLLKLRRVTIADHGDGNSGIALGGGLYNGGTARLLDVSFNSDDAGAGGAIGQDKGSLSAVNVTINNCGADTNARGGAVAINGGKATFTDSTIANSFMLAEGVPAGCFGVAIYANNSAVQLINDTITNSQLFALGFGNPGDVPTAGAIFAGGVDKMKIGVSVGNTVVSGMNLSAGILLGSGPEIVGRISSLGHNLIGQTGPTTFGLKPSDLVGTHASPLDPELNALADNGGFVETELPELGSPLIDAGDNSLIPAGIATDERGQNRIFGGIVDIGAVETNYVVTGNG